MPSDPASAGFPARLAETAGAVEATLAALLADEALAGETHRPPRLAAAMRHAVLAGGKRFRPFLLIECARLFGCDPAGAALPAAAVECLHTYSLVHDDLPAMDDDDLRRGLPTVHRAFDEATAILAGDALLTLAFDVLARPDTHSDATVRAELVLVLARAAGLGGMVGGQMLDLAAETTPVDAAGIRQLQTMKTGALIAASCEMGAVLGGAAASERAALSGYGLSLGLVFQIADDLLDVESDAAQLGKAASKDAARGKATFVGLFGVDGARRLLAEALDDCRGGLARLADEESRDTSVLDAAARFAAERRK